MSATERMGMGWRRHPQLVLLAVLLAAAGASVFLGRFPAPGWTSPLRLLDDPLAQRLVLHLRVPRILAAMMLGAALSGGGATMQMLFRNPLVEPGFLGVSQGAAFGAGLAILFLGGATWALQGCAAAGALLGLLASHALAQRLRFGGWILRLVLAGEMPEPVRAQLRERILAALPGFELTLDEAEDLPRNASGKTRVVIGFHPPGSPQ